MARSSTVEKHNGLDRKTRDAVWNRLKERPDNTLSRETFEQVMDVADGSTMKYLDWYTVGW